MQIRNNTLYILLAMLLAFSACANRGGGPQGGPRDSITKDLFRHARIWRK